MSSLVPESLLPNYSEPPVVETILGVQFAPIAGLTSAYLGAFWHSLDRSLWPKVVDAPPIEPQYERFHQNDDRWDVKFGLQLTTFPSPRIQIRNADSDRMIQVQNGRLHFNWLKKQGVQYPRYPVIKDEFADSLNRFGTFLKTVSFSDIKPNQWEVTYINHIPKGSVWQNPRDWNFFRPLCHVEDVQGTVAFESFKGEWHFEIPEEQGRLHVDWRHAFSSDDKREIVILTLTARGPISSEGDDGIAALMQGIDLGRSTIVRSFAGLMKDSANQYWGMK